MTEFAVEFLNHWFILDTNTGNMKSIDDPEHPVEIFNEKKFLATQNAQEIHSQENVKMNKCDFCHNDLNPNASVCQNDGKTACPACSFKEWGYKI